jgi:hypothetical protein
MAILSCSGQRNPNAMAVGMMLLFMDKMIKGRGSTYIAECSISLLECAHMTGIRLLSSQNGVTAVHPPQSSICPQVRSLTLEPSNGRVCDDPASLN